MNRACIIDIDGVIAHNPDVALHLAQIEAGDFTSFTEAIPKMRPIPEMVKVVKLLARSGDIIFVTARHEDNRAETEAWLNRHLKLKGYKLLMRQAPGPDHLIKYHLYREHIYHKYEVIMAVDDSELVIGMWDSLGIPTIHYRNRGNRQ